MWDLIVSVPDHCLSFYFEQIAKLEAKSCPNFIICSLMRLKLAKVVHWNFLIIVNKEQKPKLSSLT